MHSDKVKVLFLLPTMHAGGAERVISFVASQCDNKIFKVKLLVVGLEKESQYKIDNLEPHFLNKKRVLDSIPALISYLAKNKPDIVLSSVTHLNTVVGLISILFPKIKFIARQASISSISDKSKKRSIYNILQKISYPQFDSIICQSKDMLEDVLTQYRVSKHKMMVINNPITISSKTNFEYRKEKEPVRFITVGRLAKIKGHKRLLLGLSKVNYSFHYTIIGSGLEKEILEKLVKELGISNKVTFVNHTKDVSTYLAINDWFLQGSFSEGFPNALLESCAMGTPVIAFDVPGGTKEIVEHGINGFLVKSEEELLHCLNNLITLDKEKVSESVYKKFGKDRILNQYESFFKEILSIAK